MNCPDCGHENPEDAQFCIQCGKELKARMNCRYCGSELVEGAGFCPSCGKAIGEKESEKQPQGKPTAQTGKMEQLHEKYHLPFKPIWLIVLLAIVLVLVGGYFLIFHIPRACRPLNKAIIRNGYEYGCNDEKCTVWLHEAAELGGYNLKYQWDNGQQGMAECAADIDSPEMLICTFPVDNTEGGVLITAGNANCASLPVIYLDEDDLAELQEDSLQNMCAVFSQDVENVVQQAQWTYEYDPLFFILHLQGLTQYETLTARYAWGNGVDDAKTCHLEPNGQYDCYIPAEVSSTDLDLWLRSGGCEQHIGTFDDSGIDWQRYESCSPEYLQAIRSLNGKFSFGCGDDYCFIWVSDVDAFEDATIAYRFDGEKDITYSPKCSWDDSTPGQIDLACIFLLEEDLRGVTVYIDNNGCPINLGYLDKGRIEANQEKMAQTE